MNANESTTPPSATSWNQWTQAHKPEFMGLCVFTFGLALIALAIWLMVYAKTVNAMLCILVLLTVTGTVLGLAAFVLAVVLYKRYENDKIQ